METVIKTKEAFIELMNMHYEECFVQNKGLNEVIDRFYSELKKDEYIDIEELDKQLILILTSYLYSNYNIITVTEENEIYGINEGKKELLLESDNSFLYTDATATKIS